MSERVHQKRGPDRRKQARGGRRPTDRWGYAPLVFVVDSRPTGRDACEAILAKLRFAVAPFDSVAQAAKVLNALRPDIILVGTVDERALKDAVAGNPGSATPVVVIPEHDTEAVALIEAVRTALRAAPVRR